MRISFPYSPEKEPLLKPLIERFNGSAHGGRRQAGVRRGPRVVLGRHAEAQIADGPLTARRVVARLLAVGPAAELRGRPAAGPRREPVDRPHAAGDRDVGADGEGARVPAQAARLRRHPRAGAVQGRLGGVRAAGVRRLQARPHQPGLLDLGPVGRRRRVLRGDGQEGGAAAGGRHGQGARDRSARSSAASSTTATRRCSSPTRCARAGSATPPRWRWRRRRCWTSTSDRGGQPEARRDLSVGGHVLLRQPVHRARRGVGHARSSARARRRSSGSSPRRSRPRWRPAAASAPPTSKTKPVAPIRPRTAPTRRSPSASSACPSRACWRSSRDLARGPQARQRAARARHLGLDGRRGPARERQGRPAGVPRPGRAAGPRRADWRSPTEIDAARARRPVRARTARAARRRSTRLIADGGTAVRSTPPPRASTTVQDLADRDDRINAVVLLTDGEDTDSSRDVDDVVRELEGQGDSSTQVRVFTIAYSAGARGRARGAQADRRGVRRQRAIRATLRTSRPCTARSARSSSHGRARALQPRRVRRRAGRQRRGQAVQHRGAGGDDGRGRRGRRRGRSWC